MAAAVRPVWWPSGLGAAFPLLAPGDVGNGRAGPPRPVPGFPSRHLHWRLGKLAPAGTRREQTLALALERTSLDPPFVRIGFLGP